MKADKKDSLNDQGFFTLGGKLHKIYPVVKVYSPMWSFAASVPNGYSNCIDRPCLRTTELT